MGLRARGERALLAAAMALPEPIQQTLAGRPVVIDGQQLANDVQLMLRLQRLARERGAETMPIPEGRAAVRRHAALTAGVQPIGSVRDLVAGGRPARLYAPTSAGAAGPLLVFFHGGGFIYGDLDSHDPPCRVLAERGGVRVLAVDYRLAPEHPFPAAYDDAIAAHRWALEHAAELGADPARIGVGGDSAGGNLAAGAALAAARDGRPCAVQLLVYPATDARRATRSLELFGDGFYLNRAFMDLANRSYAKDEADLDDPRLSPAYADLTTATAGRLAPALVFTAGFDPLRDEGEAYAAALEKAGTPVELVRFEDQIHGFFNIVGVGRTPPACVRRIADALGAALAG